MTEPSARSRPSPLLAWFFAVGSIALLGLNVFLNPPDGGVAASRPGYAAGHIAGQIAVLGLVALLVYAVARFVRRGKAAPNALATTFWTLLVFAVFSVLSAASGTRLASDAAVLSPEDRQALLVEPDSIRHPHIGFAIPNPGSALVSAPELQARLDKQLAGHAGMAAWILATADPRSTVTIQVTKFALLDERRFREFALGTRSGATRSGTFTLLDDSLTWRPANGDYRMTLKANADVWLKMRCVSRSRSEGHYVLCVQTTSAGSDSLDAVRTGLSMRE